MSFINPEMKNPAWFKRAKSLRQAGFTYKAIAEFCNVSVGGAHYAVNCDEKRINRRLPDAQRCYREIDLTSENLAKITAICNRNRVTLDVIRLHSQLSKANRARREIISHMLELGCTRRQIADMLFVSKASVCHIIHDRRYRTDKEGFKK